MSNFPSSSTSFETLLLERLELGLHQAVSNQALHGVRIDSIDTMVDMLKDQLLLRLRAHVWSDPSRRYKKTHKVSYDLGHPTWKHHLTASLRKDSFLRRWCHFFWDIPFDYATTRATHIIEVDIRAIFPESTMHYPEALGQVHIPIQLSQTGYVEEPYYVR